MEKRGTSCTYVRCTANRARGEQWHASAFSNSLVASRISSHPQAAEIQGITDWSRVADTLTSSAYRSAACAGQGMPEFFARELARALKRSDWRPHRDAQEGYLVDCGRSLSLSLAS